MAEYKKPLLSIAMIFRDDIRCLERCMKSLQPLREAIPCELVMADTGSVDGSRAIAEQYADVLFDFPWINDFAAARNAVMDRCTGEWCMTMDTDEWMSDDISGLVHFLEGDQECDYAAFNCRNYKTTELELGNAYSDFISVRVVRMSTGARYTGAIHEHWSFGNGAMNAQLIEHTFLHHDGYVFRDAASRKKKVERNMAVLKKELEESPHDLKVLMQCIESGEGTPEFSEYIERAARAVEEKRDRWKMFGPPIFRYAVIYADSQKRPELDAWIKRAEEWFPNSVFTLVDVEFIAFKRSWEKKDYQDCIRRGEVYLKATREYEKGEIGRVDTLCSTLALESPNWQMQAKIFLSGAYLYNHQPEKALEYLKCLDGSQMDVKQVGDCLRVYTHLWSRSHLELAPYLPVFWEQINQFHPSETRAVQRKNEFIRMGNSVFNPAYRKSETQQEDFCRHGYTLFHCLYGKDCILGTAAVLMDAEEPEVMRRELVGAESLLELPVPVMEHVMLSGVDFPLSNRPMCIEEMDLMAGRMAREGSQFMDLVQRFGEQTDTESEQQISWARALALVAVRICDWKKDTEASQKLCRLFTKVEQQFIALCYNQKVLCEESIRILPPMHRFGWYCGQAFQALEKENPMQYVKWLQKGLSTCKEAKGMVEFLLEDVREQQRAKFSPELLNLAEQVRAVLSQYQPDAPAVRQLLEQPQYQILLPLLGAEYVALYRANTEATNKEEEPV